MLARAQARHRPEVARQWTGRRGSELLRDAEPDDARVERENVGGQAGIIRIEAGIRDRCRVEYVFDIGFDRQIFWAIDAKRNVEVFPALDRTRTRLKSRHSCASRMKSAA